MRYYPRAGRNRCRDACARLFGHDSWEDLGLSIELKATAAPFDEDCSYLDDRWRAQARLLCSLLGDVDPDEEFARPTPAQAVPDPIESVLRTEVRMIQASNRYQQLLARVLVAECQPTASKPDERACGELLASASRGTIEAMPLYLARWWSVNLKHQREVGEALSNIALDADSRADLLWFGQYWGKLCMYHAHTIAWTMVIGTAYLLAERYADLSLPNITDISALYASKPTDAYKRVCELHWLLVLDYLSVFPRDDLEEVARAQPGAFLANGNDVLAIFSNPRSKRGTWQSSGAR
jgi:hypothetical protein